MLSFVKAFLPYDFGFGFTSFIKPSMISPKIQSVSIPVSPKIKSFSLPVSSISPIIVKVPSVSVSVNHISLHLSSIAHVFHPIPSVSVIIDPVDEDFDDTCSILSDVSFIVDYSEDDFDETNNDNDDDTDNVDDELINRCLGITSQGARCQRVQTTDFCWQHQPRPEGSCNGIKNDGTLCTFKAIFEGFCGVHKPRQLHHDHQHDPSIHPNHIQRNIQKLIKDRIHPPFTYQGGKSRLLKDLLPLFPSTFNNYFEPFIGGGAVCFARLPYSASISDIDPFIINIYKNIKDNFTDFMFYFELFGHIFMELDNDTLSYEVYDLLNSDIDDVIKSVLYIFITRCCFRGLVKRNGSHFTRENFYKRVSIGLMSKLRNHLNRLHSYLQFVNVECSEFSSVVDKTAEGDFVYLDPPYYYESGEGHIAYDHDNRERERTIIHEVREVMDELSRKKVKVMMSMSDYPYVRELFADYNIHVVEIRRNLRRGVVIVTELVIRNYL